MLVPYSNLPKSIMKTITIFVIYSILLVSLYSCQKSDPASEFKGVVEETKAKVNAGISKNNAQTTNTILEESYDVQKTDSLVSPYTAFWEYNVKSISTYSNGNTQESLEDLYVCRREYVYQDKNWLEKAKKYRNLSSVYPSEKWYNFDDEPGFMVSISCGF